MKFIVFKIIYKILIFITTGSDFGKKLRSVGRIYKKIYGVDKKNGKKFLIETFFSIIFSAFYNRLKRNKTSSAPIKNRTLFLLGSGPTINDLSKSNWLDISHNTSWGFNFWIVHDFVPDAMFLQTPYKHEQWDNLLAHLLAIKSEVYKESIFFVRGDAVNKRKFNQTAVGGVMSKLSFKKEFLAEAFIPSDCKVHPEALIDAFDKEGFFEPNSTLPIPKFGSTISMMISYALRMGYQEVVLCGIDMKDTRHFYDDEQYLDKFPELSIIRDKSRVDLHPHMAKERPYSVKDQVLALKEYTNKKLGGEIYVSSNNSALHPQLPVYKFN